MHFEGKGGPPYFAEAMWLFRLAAAKGHAGARASMDNLDRAKEVQRAQEQVDADAMMWLRCWPRTWRRKSNGAAKSTKSAKSKKSLASAAPPSAAAPAAPVTPPSSGATIVETAAPL